MRFEINSHAVEVGYRLRCEYGRCEATLFFGIHNVIRFCFGKLCHIWRVSSVMPTARELIHIFEKFWGLILMIRINVFLDSCLKK